MPGAGVYIQRSDNPDRKTQWDLIAVERTGRSSTWTPRCQTRQWKNGSREGNLFLDVTRIKPEYKYGNSRIDFLVETEEKKVLIEVKGVTLKGGRNSPFPGRAKRQSSQASGRADPCGGRRLGGLCVFRYSDERREKILPNVDTHPEFAKALWKAKEKGVRLIARDCIVTEDEIRN